MRSVLSIHWGLSVGGVSTYAATLERLRQHYPLRLKSLCLLQRGREIDSKVLAALDAIVIPIASVFDPSWITKVRAVVAQEAPDGVLSHGFNGHFVSLLGIPGGQRVKRIATYHGEYHPHTLVRRLAAPVYNGFTHYFLRSKASSILSVSQAGAEILVGSGVARDKINVIHNGIPDFVATPQARLDIRRSWGVGEDEIVVGTASRLEAIKGLNYLIEAVAELSRQASRVRLVLIGEGSERGALEQHAAALGLGSRVLFAGMRSDVPDCLSAMDIFALPSLSEAHSIGLVEAMRAGKAIVATNVGGNTESVADEREALVVKAADAKVLAGAIGRLALDDDLRKSLGDAARARFLECFTERRMLDRTAQWLLDACAG